MIATLKQMILCVTAASLFGSIVLSLTEQKAQQEILRIAVGMMLVLSLITPIRAIRLPDLSWLESFSGSGNAQADAEAAYTQTVLEEFETEVEAYLEQLAEQQGISCTITITAVQEEDAVSICSAEVLFPQEATEEQRQQVQDIVIQELGISEREITLAGGEPDGTEEKAVDVLLE
ncbi:MAG: hypothetical protein Q4F79_06055 [Eubacteriales bacterium]|nr:hypothetical protein [Eubacteriales bacterium]